MRQGTDHSYHKGKVNYNKMMQSSEFDILRAGYGKTEDSIFQTNRANVNGLMPWGAYWYYTNNIKPAHQAAKFIDVLGDNQGDLPLFADFESSKFGKYLGWKYWAVFIEELERLAPEKEVVIYTRASYWKVHCNRWNMLRYKSSAEFFAKHNIWLAAYNNRSVDKQTIPYPFTRKNFILWQYSDTTPAQSPVDFGVDKYNAKFIDTNFYVGDEWKKFIGGFGDIKEKFFPPRRIRCR